MSQEIAIDALIPHPENCNSMNEETLGKLKRHIKDTGRYEPITARPHPLEPGKYQVINGHHRLKVLKELGHKTAKCSVWDIDDTQTRLYLATLDRLSGSDVPERRVILLEKLLASFEVDELAALLPDPKIQLAELERMLQSLPQDVEALMETANEEVALETSIPVMLSFMLDETSASKVNMALDRIIVETGNISRSQALSKLADIYLKNAE